MRTYRIMHGCQIGKKVDFGEEVFINTGCYFDSSDWVHLGDRTFVGPNCAFLTSTHELGSSVRRAGKTETKPIFIGDGCWIGAGSIILPGVSIGAGTVIAAGSVVTRDCDADSLYAGNPAVQKKQLA